MFPVVVVNKTASMDTKIHIYSPDIYILVLRLTKYHEPYLLHIVLKRNSGESLAVCFSWFLKSSEYTQALF